MGAVILVTRDNIDWAAQMTGKTVEEIVRLLEKAEAEDVVCTLPVSSGAPVAAYDFPRNKGSW